MSNKKKVKVITKNLYSKKQKDILEKQVTIEISFTGKKIILFSIVLLIVGFGLLKFSDPEGTNWASIISPFVIIFSYIGMAIGLLHQIPKNLQK
jgi:hypothetical protein